MTICSHCKGTGQAPIRLKQECVGCQKQITVLFADTAEMVKNDGLVYCADCKRHLTDEPD